MAQSQKMGQRRRASSRWWSSPWLYATVNRVGSEGPFIFLIAYPAQATACHHAEALIRTGGNNDPLLLAASLLPYWRVGVVPRDRGYPAPLLV